MDVKSKLNNYNSQNNGASETSETAMLCIEHCICDCNECCDYICCCDNCCDCCG